MTDGPFSEFKEWLAGFQVVDVASEARAIEIAAGSRPCRDVVDDRRSSRSTCGRSWTSRPPTPRAWTPSCAPPRARPERTDARRGPAARARAAGRRRRSAAGSATSTRPRTPCRRRCSRHPGSGRATACPDSPRAWLVTVGVAPARRPVAQRLGAPARGRPASSPWDVPAGDPDDRDDTPDPAPALLPPGADAGVGDRADAARRRRPHHRRDRARVPRARGDDGAADQPGQGDASARPEPASVCRPLPSSTPGSPPCCTSSTSSSTRATRPAGADAAAHRPRRARRSGSTAPARTRLLPDDARGHRPAGPHAAHRRARGPARTDGRRRAGAAGRAGPLAAGTPRSSPRASPCSTTRWPDGAVGDYQLQAAIAAVHDEAATAAEHRLARRSSRSTTLLERVDPQPRRDAQPCCRRRDGGGTRCGPRRRRRRRGRARRDAPVAGGAGTAARDGGPPRRGGPAPRAGRRDRDERGRASPPRRPGR